MSGVSELGSTLDNVAHGRSDISDVSSDSEFAERLGLEGSIKGQDRSGATNIPARLGTPPPEILDQYRDPASLPVHDGKDPKGGIRHYGSVEVHGGPSAWEAYENLRRQPTHQARNVIATIENLDDRYVEVHPYTIQQGIPAETYLHPDTTHRISRETQTVQGSIVKFGINQGAFAANGTAMPPNVPAFHELQHAAEAQYAVQLTKVRRGHFGNEFEKRPIQQIETELLEHAGLTPRDSLYPAFFYQTEGLHSATPHNDLVAQALTAKQPTLIQLTEKLHDFRVDQANPPDAQPPADPAQILNGAEALSVRDSEMRELRAQVESLEGRPRRT